MKPFRIVVIATLTVILTGLATMFLVQVWFQAHLLHPDLQNESAFLKSYSPQPVVDAFKCKTCASELLSGGGAAAGRRFVKRTVNFDSTFAIRPEQQLDLMNALRADLLTRLGACGARVLRQTSSAHEGFRADYACNTSVGSVSILPLGLARPDVQGGLPPQGLQQVTLHVVIDERWYPNRADALEASTQPNP